MKILACLVCLTAAALHADAWSWPRSLDSFADRYSSMGDVDWAKRDNWINPKYGYSSMADSEWGWRKRNNKDDDEDDESDIFKRNIDHRHNYQVSYRQRQPYTLARSSYLPYKPKFNDGAHPLAEVIASEPQRNTRSRFGDRQYKFASMADLDWGWRKKRNLASLARQKLLPQKHVYRRLYLDEPEDSNDYPIVETRSGIGSLARIGALRPSHLEGQQN